MKNFKMCIVHQILVGKSIRKRWAKYMAQMERMKDEYKIRKPQ